MEITFFKAAMGVVVTIVLTGLGYGIRAYFDYKSTQTTVKQADNEAYLKDRASFRKNLLDRVKEQDKGIRELQERQELQERRLNVLKQEVERWKRAYWNLVSWIRENFDINDIPKFHFTQDEPQEQEEQ